MWDLDQWFSSSKTQLNKYAYCSRTFLLCALAAILTIQTLMTLLLSDTRGDQLKITKSAESKYAGSKSITILTWTKMDNNNDIWFPRAQRAFDKCYNNGFLTHEVCEFTEDRSRLLEADVLLFRARQLNKKDLPHIRSKKQQYLVYEYEPPHKTWKYLNLTKYNSFFNLTATYAYDSDIPMVQQRRYVVAPKKFEALKDRNFASRKRSDVPVTWFVSRCPTQSKREDYVRNLQKFINVDVYGRCGNLTCESNRVQSDRRFRDDECLDSLLNGRNSYKFYLAFENSLCEDYVSEKLWKVMKVNVVPVVMGSVSYSSMLPRDSFIDVRDYASPKHLAHYLNYLNENDEAYSVYIRTKASLVLDGLAYAPRECLICQGLHKLRKRVGIVYAFDLFWSARRCMLPEVFFSNNGLLDFGVNLKLIH